MVKAAAPGFQTREKSLLSHVLWNLFFHKLSYRRPTGKNYAPESILSIVFNRQAPDISQRLEGKKRHLSCLMAMNFTFKTFQKRTFLSSGWHVTLVFISSWQSLSNHKEKGGAHLCPNVVSGKTGCVLLISVWGYG